uniref:Peptidase A2 domain-containing protein n=1 Tax=Globisporangium ultimum (strain ATCC 200006 / CBS 805.95 / DAOM BR144) TaxID=431595 RepID=K3X3V2_GLOUD
MVVLENAMQVPYCADSGADQSCISMSAFKKLISSCPWVLVRNQTQPILCEVTDGRRVLVDNTVEVHLSLRTAAGPVNLEKPIVCLVVPGDDDEFLLDVLDILGINVDRELGNNPPWPSASCP